MSRLVSSYDKRLKDEFFSYRRASISLIGNFLNKKNTNDCVHFCVHVNPERKRINFTGSNKLPMQNGTGNETSNQNAY